MGNPRSTVSTRTRMTRFALSSSNRTARFFSAATFTTLSPNGGAPVTRNHIARLNADGTLDTGFNPNANGLVYAIAVQSDGKILLGGLFTTLSPNGGGTVTRNRMARLNPDGTLDAAFDPNADGIVESIAVQTNGQILAGGFFTTIGGETRNFIARLDATTGLADSFDPNADAIVSAITLQADGKILLGGSFESIGGQPRNHIARLDAGSGLADSFDPDASHAVVSIAIQADGKILAAGQFMRIGGEFRNRIARLDPTNGSPDSFDPIADNAVNSIVVQADGMILVGGSFTTIGPSDRPDGNFGQVRNYIARIDPTTGLPDSFNPNANDPVSSIAVQSDGKILAGGLFTTLAPNGGTAVTRNRIARLEADGRLDRTLREPRRFRRWNYVGDRDAAGRQDSNRRRVQRHLRRGAWQYCPSEHGRDAGYCLRSERER